MERVYYYHRADNCCKKKQQCVGVFISHACILFNCSQEQCCSMNNRVSRERFMWRLPKCNTFWVRKYKWEACEICFARRLHRIRTLSLWYVYKGELLMSISVLPDGFWRMTKSGSWRREIVSINLRWHHLIPGLVSQGMASCWVPITPLLCEGGELETTPVTLEGKTRTVDWGKYIYTYKFRSDSLLRNSVLTRW